MHCVARVGRSPRSPRHLGRDRKTIRGYLADDRVAGVRARTDPDPFEVFAPYCGQRLADDPHLWASALFDEVTDLGYVGSYPTMTRQIRIRGLRSACEPCRPAKGRPIAVIEHPAGEETQWDWVELPDPPVAWGWGPHAHLLVGALSHSGVWRGLWCSGGRLSRTRQWYVPVRRRVRTQPPALRTRRPRMRR
jgi:hypothetical protein